MIKCKIKKLSIFKIFPRNCFLRRSYSNFVLSLERSLGCMKLLKVKISCVPLSILNLLYSKCWCHFIFGGASNFWLFIAKTIAFFLFILGFYNSVNHSNTNLLGTWFEQFMMQSDWISFYSLSLFFILRRKFMRYILKLFWTCSSHSYYY